MNKLHNMQAPATKYLVLIVSFLIFQFHVAISRTQTYPNQVLKDVAKNIKCLVCNGESVYDSSSSFAIAMRQFIIEKISQDYDQEEILKQVKNIYGEEILLTPSFASYNIILWSAPGILLIIICIVFYSRATRKA